MADESVTPQAAEPITQGQLNVPPPARGSVDEAALKIDGLLGAGEEPEGDPQPAPAADDEEQVTREEPVSEDEESSASDDTTDDDTVELPGRVSELAEALDISEEDFGAILVKTKVNGVESEVTLAEAVKGYQRNEDYTRQTMELADKRRQFESEVEQATEQLRQRFSHMDRLTKQLADMVQGQEKSLQTYLDNGNYPGYIQAQHKLEAQKKALEAAQAQQDQQKHQQTQEQHRKLAAFVQQSRERMLAKHPELGDEKRGPEIMQNMQSYLGEKGFKPEDIEQMYDDRIVDVVLDAMRYSTLNKAKPDEKLQKAKPVKRVLKSGASRTKTDGLKEKLAAARRQQRASGSIEDTADVFKQMGFN